MPLRPATASHIPALARVHLASWLAAYRGVMADASLDALTPAVFEGYHRARFSAEPPHASDPAQPFLVATDDAGDIVAFARGGPTRDKSPTGDPLPDGFAQRWSAELYAIYVHPDHMNRGHGRILFGAIAQALAARDHKNLCLWVLTHNRSGRNFYDRCQGQLAGESTITIDGKPYPQVAYSWDNITDLTQI
ncbi:MAG: GNAT family N-acetyltransferase [Phycisphaerales bacterium]